jgi:hypothetical protein
MSSFRMTARARAALAAIEAAGAAHETRRASAIARGERAAASNRSVVLDRAASVIVARWRAAGYTTGALVDGLPRPERPHVAGWDHSARVPRCSVCGRAGLRSPLPATCEGVSVFELVHQALENHVPFGIGPSGLPTAGVPAEPGDVVKKLARATCRPLARQEQRQAA